MKSIIEKISGLINFGCKTIKQDLIQNYQSKLLSECKIVDVNYESKNVDVNYG
jgi:hypothetical protein